MKNVVQYHKRQLVCSSPFQQADQPPAPIPPRSLPPQEPVRGQQLPQEEQQQPQEQQQQPPVV